MYKIASRNNSQSVFYLTIINSLLKFYSSLIIRNFIAKFFEQKRRRSKKFWTKDLGALHEKTSRPLSQTPHLNEFYIKLKNKDVRESKFKLNLNSRAGFLNVGRFAPKGSILVSYGAKIRKGAKGGAKICKGAIGGRF